MGTLLTRMGRLVLFSRRHKCVRRTVVFLLSNFLLIAGCVFAVEVLIIFLGIANICIPIDPHALSFLTRFFS